MLDGATAVVLSSRLPDGLPAATYGSLMKAADADAMVAGFVPGIALGWSWPGMLRHAVALAAAGSGDGTVDLAAYEARLPDVAVAAKTCHGAAGRLGVIRPSRPRPI